MDETDPDPEYPPEILRALELAEHERTAAAAADLARRARRLFLAAEPADAADLRYVVSACPNEAVLDLLLKATASGWRLLRHALQEGDSAVFARVMREIDNEEANEL